MHSRQDQIVIVRRCEVAHSAVRDNGRLLRCGDIVPLRANRPGRPPSHVKPNAVQEPLEARVRHTSFYKASAQHRWSVTVRPFRSLLACPHKPRLRRAGVNARLGMSRSTPWRFASDGVASLQSCCNCWGIRCRGLCLRKFVRSSLDLDFGMCRYSFLSISIAGQPAHISQFSFLFRSLLRPDPLRSTAAQDCGIAMILAPTALLEKSWLSRWPFCGALATSFAPQGPKIEQRERSGCNQHGKGLSSGAYMAQICL